MSIFDSASILVTGGAGAFGKKFCEVLLRDHAPKKVIIFSRDELKQHDMKAEGFDAPCMRYCIGDIRDKERLKHAMTGVDIVVHAAALKHVPACELNPIEAVQTNIGGSQNIVDAAIDTNVQKVLALSTDKAVHPNSVYGATKLVAEKLFTQGNTYTDAKVTRFACVRYGNVIGSRGSVIPLFEKQRETGTITITDDRMTRFWITPEQSARFVLDSITAMRGGEIFVPKIPSMKVADLATAIAPNCTKRYIGIRPGEKLHEALLSSDESRRTVETDTSFVIQPEHDTWSKDPWPKPNVKEGFCYSSETNPHWLTQEQLQELLQL